MAFSHLHSTRLSTYLSRIVILASAKAIPYPRCETVRLIMSTPSTYSNSSVPQIQLYDFERHIQNKTCIIDVREPKELQETGVIPHSINIPLGEVESAFQLPADIFEKKYKCSKPNPSETLVFSCRSGKRSQLACEQLSKLGYAKVINFAEGWLGWEEKLKQQLEQKQ